MYLYDYNNGMIEVGSGEVEVGLWVQDYYSVEYECPLCSGSGEVLATEAETDEEYEIECPHCHGRGECEDEIYIDIDEYQTVEVEGKCVGAYGDNDLYYSYGKVTDTVNENGVYETIQRMIERQKEERQASLTEEERKAVELEKKVKEELEKIMVKYEKLKAEVDRILEC
jgi:excinuclease UvrABC ATPase subunit